MAEPFVRPYDGADSVHIAANMRFDDARECIASGMTPRQAIVNGTIGSNVSTICLGDGTPVAVFGCVGHPFTHIIGIPWLLGTDDIQQISVPFLRHCRAYIADFHKTYPVLMNYVSEDNMVHRRWLQWCGFIENPKRQIRDNIPFILVQKEV